LTHRAEALPPRAQVRPVKRVLRDLKTWGFLAIGTAFLTAALSFWRADARFFEQATPGTAVVVEKFGGDGDSDSSEGRHIRYEWLDTTVEPPTKQQDSAAFSGDRAAFDALVPGQSTVRIAWRTGGNDGGPDSRLVEGGFVGMPWSMLLVGLGMLSAVPIRALLLIREGSRTLS